MKPKIIERGKMGGFMREHVSILPFLLLNYYTYQIVGWEKRPN
jgi:hypothetical protein